MWFPGQFPYCYRSLSACRRQGTVVGVRGRNECQHSGTVRYRIRSHVVISGDFASQHARTRNSIRRNGHTRVHVISVISIRHSRAATLVAASASSPDPAPLLVCRVRVNQRIRQSRWTQVCLSTDRVITSYRNDHCHDSSPMSCCLPSHRRNHTPFTVQRFGLRGSV